MEYLRNNKKMLFDFEYDVGVIENVLLFFRVDDFKVVGKMI